MRINADFSRPVVVRPQDREWVPSPSGGVERCMLDRIGGEVARATSLVRFAPNSSFPTHMHGGGEEYIVLDGTFSDDTGDFPAGTYVRNPIGTAHAPHTHEGCMIFVKLWQFADDDRAQFDVAIGERLGGAAKQDGRSEAVLHDAPGERVRVHDLDAGTALALDGAGGMEVLVLAGSLASADDDAWSAGTWARFPDDEPLRLTAGADGARVWTKAGHLTDIRVPDVA